MYGARVWPIRVIYVTSLLWRNLGTKDVPPAGVHFYHLENDGKLTRPLLGAVWLLPYLLAEDFFEASSPDVLVRGLADKVLSAFGTSRKDMERVAQLLLAVRRFRQTSKKSKRSAPKALLGKSYFDEAIKVYEFFLEATGGDVSELDWWMEQRQSSLAKKKSKSSSKSKQSGGDEEKRSRRRRFRKRKKS